MGSGVSTWYRMEDVSIGKRAVGFQLKGFLVFLVFIFSDISVHELLPKHLYNEFLRVLYFE